MDENIVNRITRETVDRIKYKKAIKRDILLIFMGGDREVDISLDQVKILSSMNVNLSAYLTKSAEIVIGREKVIAAGVKRIFSESEIWDRSIAEGICGIIIPVLTLNGAGKIANMIADSPATNIILLALRNNKKVLLAKDAVVCCGVSDVPVASMFMRKLNEIVNAIRNLGVVVTVAKNLTREAVQLFDLDTKFIESEVSSIDVLCPGSTEECTECGLCVINRENDVKAIINAGASRIASKQVNGNISDNLSPYIDHTNLKADVTQEQIGKLCEEAKLYNFATVCINPSNVSFTKKLLQGSKVGVTTVVGFPLGATTPTVKAIEARDAIANGADEIDMVINVGALKSGNLQLVEDDIKAVRSATKGKILKVILETALLNSEQIVKACHLAKSAGADFVKTSTGFGPGGATVEDIKLMRDTVGLFMGVKASGGIRTDEDAKNMIEAGATRIGASASVAIVTGGKSEEDY